MSPVFLIDKLCYDVIILAYYKPFGADNPNGAHSTRFSS
jgi:hypothetical protein